MENSFKGLFEIERCLIGRKRPNTINAINQKGEIGLSERCRKFRKLAITSCKLEFSDFIMPLSVLTDLTIYT